MKKVHKLIFAATAIVLLFSLGGWQYTAQPYFEGEIVFKIGMDGTASEAKKNNMPQNMTLYYKGNRMKMTVTGGKKERDIIYDLSEQVEYSIDHEAKKVFKKTSQRDNESMGRLLKEIEFTLEAKPDTPVIAGYKCRRHVISADMKGAAIIIDLFTSDEIKIRKNALSNPFMDKIGLKTDQVSGFPLGMKFSFQVAGKSESIMMEAEEVNDKKIPYGFFALPKGYEIVER